ncbi:MAG: RDD family protein [Flavobacteriales bacterium]|nr:RDD family protein [Flavobacteriales bacterium]
MANLEINTTQNVNLDYKIASFGWRILALLIDLSLLFLYFYLIGQITSLFEDLFTDKWSVLALQNILFFPVMFYSLYMNILFQGRTVGKMMVNIRVVRLDGYPLHWSHYMVRWMLRLVDIWFLSGTIGILVILLTEKSQRLGDAAAGSVVIYTKKKVRISHTILEELETHYKPTFLTVTQLSDKDVRLIKETFLIAKKSRDYKTLNALRLKVESVLEINSEFYDIQFIDTVLKDYNYFTQNMG